MQTSSLKKAVFFDRDGIVNKRIVGEYISSFEDFEFLPEIFDLMQKTKQAGFLAIVITNQQGIGKGLITENDVEMLHFSMQNAFLEKIGVNFDDIFVCGDLANSGSLRRKPEPGMILEAMEKWNIDAENSWMIGDSETDALAGKQAGTKSILIGDFAENKTVADYIFLNLAAFQEKFRQFLR